MLNETFTPESGIQGLTLRNWRDESDYVKMRRVLHADKHSQGLEEARSDEDFRRELETIPGLNVARDVFLVEHEGEVIAYQTVRHVREAEGKFRYAHHGFVMPTWKGRGIGRAMIRHAEATLREIAANDPADAPKFFQTFAESKQMELIHLLEQEGYVTTRYFYEMLRDRLDDLPEIALPKGIEARPVQPEHYRAIWNALLDAFREHWGEEEHGEADFQRWIKNPHFQPQLWQIAWDGDRVVSMVINYIDENDNVKYNRRRGINDDIATLKEYRGRGIAQALIVRSFQLFKQFGLTEAALGVDSENATGALRLYEKLGYRPIRTMIAYRKNL